MEVENGILRLKCVSLHILPLSTAQWCNGYHCHLTAPRLDPELGLLITFRFSSYLQR